MLDKFRQNFPTKSLVSEFLGINNGVYAVQCRIVGDGLTLNAIASGSTVEMAEDAARDRVLRLFFAGEAITTPIANEEIKKGDPVCIKDNGSCSVLRSNAYDFASIIAAHAPLKEGQTLEITLPASGSGEITTIDGQPTKERPMNELLETKKDIMDSQNCVLVPCTEEQPPKKRSPKKKEPTPELVETVAKTAIAEPKVIKPVLPEKEEISNAIAEPEPEPEPEPVKAPVLELTAPTPQLELISPPSFEPIDFSDVIAKTTKHMARLKWSNEYGKDYLIATYNKRSRQLLSDEELLEFLQYLESQPDPS